MSYVSILADLVDAADPATAAGVREDLVERAHTADPVFAFSAATMMLHWLLDNYREQFGSDATSDVVRQMRVACGQMFTQEPS